MTFASAAGLLSAPNKSFSMNELTVTRKRAEWQGLKPSPITEPVHKVALTSSSSGMAPNRGPASPRPRFPLGGCRWKSGGWGLRHYRPHVRDSQAGGVRMGELAFPEAGAGAAEYRQISRC